MTKHPTDTPYSRALRAAREAAGIRQTDLAKAMGMHRAQLSDVELGGRAAFHVSRTRELAEATGADHIHLMALAAGERGIDSAMTEGACTESLETLITLVEMLPKMTSQQAAKIRKYLSRL